MVHILLRHKSEKGGTLKSKYRYFARAAESLKKRLDPSFQLDLGWMDQGILFIQLQGEWGHCVATVHPWSATRVKVYMAQHEELPAELLAIRDLTYRFSR